MTDKLKARWREVYEASKSQWAPAEIIRITPRFVIAQFDAPGVEAVAYEIQLQRPDNFIVGSERLKRTSNKRTKRCAVRKTERVSRALDE